MAQVLGTIAHNTPTPAGFCWLHGVWLWLLLRVAWPGVLYQQTLDRQIVMKCFKVGIWKFSHDQIGSLRVSGVKQCITLRKY